MLFGHSMGAWVAYEAAAELVLRREPLPDCLLVSGNRCAGGTHSSGRPCLRMGERIRQGVPSSSRVRASHPHTPAQQHMWAACERMHGSMLRGAHHAQLRPRQGASPCWPGERRGWHGHAHAGL